MSYQYDRYLAQHKSNVEAGFRWLQKNLPEITEGSGAEHNIVFAHDQSKTEPDEYGPYDIYFYGGNRSYGVVEDFRKAWLLHIHRNPHREFRDYETGNTGKCIDCRYYASDWSPYCWKNFGLSIG